MTLQERTGEIQEIQRSAGELRLEWRISFTPSGEGDAYYETPNFIFCDGDWCLRVWPNWMRTSGWVWVCLIRNDGGPPETFHIDVGMKGSDGVEKRRVAERKFPNDGGWCWEGFCFKSESTDQGVISRWFRSNSQIDLTITCEMKTLSKARGISSYRDASIQTDYEVTEFDNGNQTSDKQGISSYRDASIQTDLEVAEFDNGNQTLDKQGIEKLLEDFGKLLASGEQSDVTAQVGDVEFKVHSLVLFARSPALSVSLQHESKEKASKKILIEDCEPAVFGEFLRFLYEGSVQSLSEQNAFSLYRVADKYLAEDLKQRCLEQIQVTLSAQTFCDAVKLALTYGESGLLQQAIDFATKNLPLIIRSVDWQNFIREYPTEANEILIKCIRP